MLITVTELARNDLNTSLTVSKEFGNLCFMLFATKVKLPAI